MPNLATQPISDSLSAANIYLDRLIVIVEAAEDVEIFKRFFHDRRDAIKFRAPTEASKRGAPANADGAEGVIRRVVRERAERRDPQRCIGFVDRDIFFSRMDWKIFFESDDNRFLDQCGLDEGIYPLMLWEIENYLLDADVVALVFSDLGPKNLSASEVIKVAAAATEHTVHLVAANCLMHEKRERKFGDGMVCDTKSAADFATYINGLVAKRIESDSYDEALQDYLKMITNHRDRSSGGETPGNIPKIVPGKAVLHFLKDRFGIQADVKKTLARRIYEDQKVHPHLIGDIEEALNA